MRCAPRAKLQRRHLIHPASVAAGLFAPMAPRPGLAQPGAKVVFPRTETAADARDRYPIQLLELALAKAQSRRPLEPHPIFMLQARALHELAQGQGLDVVWTMTSAEREQGLLPIRIPIDRGLLGWRLLLVRESELSRFAALKRAEQLQALTGGQGADWPDTAILRAAGYRIDPSARYPDLFLKLAAGRIDYFPRSVQEIWGEQALHAAKGLVVEPRLALHYPTAMYFFVSRRRADLAADIQRGLEAALADGSFDALFQRHFGAMLARARLNERRVFELKNPLLPPETPLSDARLWHRPTPAEAAARGR